MRTDTKALLIAGSFLFGASLSWVLPMAVEAPTTCVEDESCWDCSTLGNGVCGPLTADAHGDIMVLKDSNGMQVEYDRYSSHDKDFVIFYNEVGDTVGVVQWGQVDVKS